METACRGGARAGNAFFIVIHGIVEAARLHCTGGLGDRDNVLWRREDRSAGHVGQGSRVGGHLVALSPGWQGKRGSVW